MQSWEYLEIELVSQAWRGGGAREWKDSMGRSGKLEPLGQNFLNSTPLLNELGAQGWELVGVQSYETNGNTFGAKLFLKRPRT